MSFSQRLQCVQVVLKRVPREFWSFTRKTKNISENEVYFWVFFLDFFLPSKQSKKEKIQMMSNNFCCEVYGWSSTSFKIPQTKRTGNHKFKKLIKKWSFSLFWITLLFSEESVSVRGDSSNSSENWKLNWNLKKKKSFCTKFTTFFSLL